MEPVTLDPLQIWRRPSPGALAVWVRCAIAAAAAITITLITAGAHALWLQDHLAAGRSYFNSLALVAGMALVWAFVPAWRLSRFVRLAVVLPLVHVGVMFAAWWLWIELSPRLPNASTAAPTLEAAPVALVLGGTVAAVAVAGRLIGRRGEHAHAMLMLSLVALLLLGLWLPIACRFWPYAAWEDVWVDQEGFKHLHSVLRLGHPLALCAVALAPPAAAATAFTWFALRWPEAVRRHRPRLVALVLVLLAAAVTTRLGVTDTASLLYVNLVHVVISVALAAVIALVVVGVSTFLARRRARATVIADDGPTGAITSDEHRLVGCVEITSWLRGPRSLLRPFSIATRDGDVLVPAGAQLVTAIPALTTILRTGEAAPVLHRHDRVMLAGYVRDPDGHPFRGSAVPVAGSGVRVSPADDTPPSFAEVALVLWRPCVAYLAIVTAVALPALAAVFASY